MIVDDYSVDIEAPDISAYRAGNTGIDYATTFESPLPGPHVMITAVVHGNELCGAHALDFLFRNEVRPVRGRLTLAFVNVAAYLSFDPDNPTDSRYVDEDFNRVWAEDVLDGGRDSTECRRARQIRPLVDDVDLLLDIHSMQNPTMPLMMAGLLEKGRALARQVGCPAAVISDAGHAAGTRLRDYAAFGDPASQKNALLVECGQHWEESSIGVAIETTLRFLKATGVADRDFIERHLGAGVPPPQKFVEVTEAVPITTAEFHFTEDFLGMEVIAKAGTVIATDDGKDVATPYDDCVLIMPSRRRVVGQTAVRLGRFV